MMTGKQQKQAIKTLIQTVCIEGNGTRPSHRGLGWRLSEIMYTLNCTEVHCVCYEPQNNGKQKDKDSC